MLSPVTVSRTSNMDMVGKNVWLAEMEPPPMQFQAVLQNDPFASRVSPLRQGVRFAAILGAHLALLWGGLELAARPEVREMASELMVRLVETPPEAKPEAPPPPTPKPVKQAPPPPIVTAAPEVSAAPATFTVAPQPPAPPVIEAPPAPPAPAVVTGARFDADYLSNPKPVYPSASRRLGEEGKVVLRVKVSPGGTPLLVEVKQSSGFKRLDEAARAAVEQWRFVPARRGDEAIESWVAVPLVFSLQEQ